MAASDYKESLQINIYTSATEVYMLVFTRVRFENLCLLSCIISMYETLKQIENYRYLNLKKISANHSNPANVCENVCSGKINCQTPTAFLNSKSVVTKLIIYQFFLNKIYRSKNDFFKHKKIHPYYYFLIPY